MGRAERFAGEETPQLGEKSFSIRIHERTQHTLQWDVGRAQPSAPIVMETVGHLHGARGPMRTYLMPWISIGL